MSSLPIDAKICDDLGLFYADPYRFVMYAFPWGEMGPLKDYDGPDEWQKEILQEIGRQVRQRRFDGVHAVAPIRAAVSSGHGTGKSVVAAWLVCWILCTRPHSMGTITANTFPQLQTRTWAQIQRWMGLCIAGHWFKVGGERIVNLQHPATWGCSAQTCREENSESFAGQHAASSTSFYIFDESSAIPDRIWEVAEGGLTDGEPMIFALGNCTRNSGKFHRITFGSERERWMTRIVDSRTARFTNKAQLAEWIQDYGEDSDFVRVRVRGLAPRAGDLQFIGNDLVWEAQNRKALVLADEPLIAGVDIARGGADFSVIRFRRGRDAESAPQLRISGEQSRDSMLMVSKLAAILSERGERRVAHMFVDAGFGGPLVNRLHQLEFHNVTEINFGSVSPDLHQANMRAYMWAKMKEWLESGSIDKSTVLETDLTGPGFTLDSKDRLLLESKESMSKRGLASTDEADALCLTFAQPVAVPKVQGREKKAMRPPRLPGSYAPYG